MDTNKLFSFQRIAMVMKRDFLENWKTNLYRFLALYGAFLMVYLFNMREWSWYYNAPEGIYVPPVISYVNDYVPAFIGIAIFAFLYGGSLMMETMKTKELRTAYLMLPASRLEKFTARSLYVIMGVLGLLIVAMVMAELTHYLFRPFFDLPEHIKVSILPKAWICFRESVNPFGTFSQLSFVNGVETIIERSNFYNFIAVSSICLWFHSFSILGGNVWYKHAFVKTAIAFLIFFCIIAYVCVEFEPIWLSWAKHFEDYLRMLDESHVLCIVTAFFLAWTCFNWWLAYRLFTRSQVIKPKFRLL